MFNVVTIETQTNCNRTCSFCKHGLGAVPMERMSDEMISAIAHQLGALDYAGRISPFGINEPLLDTRIVSIVQQFRTACPKAYLSIVTNGDYLTIDLRDRLFEVGLDAIGISVYDDEGWAKTEAVLHPKVGRMDYRTIPANFENRGGSLEGYEPRPDLPCQRPSNMLVIRPNGDVVLCCADMYGAVVMGNVAESSLMDIWQGEKFEQHREQLQRDRRGLKLCEGCSHNGTTSSARYPL